MVTYLLTLFLLFVNFWGLRPFAEDPGTINLFLILAMLFYGYGKYGKNKGCIRVKGKYKYLVWIIVGILVSTIPTMMYYNQDILTSLMLYRNQILLLTIPVFFKMAPSLEDLSKALFLFAILMFIANLLIISDPNLFSISEERLMRYEADPEEFKLRAIQGVSLLVVPLYYYLQKLRDGFDTRVFVRIIFILVVIFISENRSSLFPATILTLYSLTKIKSKYKFFIILVIAAIVVAVFVQTMEVWSNLMLETQENIEDEDANRNKALMFFTVIGQPSWITYLFGNGIISIHTSNYTKILMENGIFYSDVGFIGYWYNFGLIPIIAILTIFINALKSKRQTYNVKLMVVHMLICSLTTSYFFTQWHLLLFMLFYYLYFRNIQNSYSKQYNIIKQTT